MNAANKFSGLKSYGGLLLEGPPVAVRDARSGGTCLSDGAEVACTVQCVHCGGHWIPVQFSGRVRGFCMLCKGPICGPGCQECVPYERQLEIREGTRKADAVTVGGNLWNQSIQS